MVLKIWFLNVPGIVLKNETFIVSFWRFRLSFPFITKKIFEEILVDDVVEERRTRIEMFWFFIGLKKISFDLCAEDDIMKMNIKIRVGYDA